MTKKEKILQWLKEHDVLEPFYNNYKSISFVKSLSSDICFIQRAFYFADTPEGDTYWWDINSKYIEWYREQFPNENITANVIRKFMEQEK